MEIAKGVAGCVICAKPIPKGSSRISMKVRLAEPKENPNGTMRRTERHNMHPGCLTKTMGSEIKRNELSCWDCGDDRDEEGGEIDPDDPFSAPARYSVFTVSRFAYAPLCQKCARKPKWRRCVGCEVFFPSHLVSPIANPPAREDVERAAVMALSTDDPKLARKYMIHARCTTDSAPELCPSCQFSSDLETVASVEQARAEFEELRARIADVGIDEA